MKKLTFKQYLESKEQLLKAIENIPVTIVEYEVRKYCTFPVGTSESEKELINLKPKNKIIVEWKYDDIHHPTPTQISFKGTKNLDESERCSIFWSGDKLNKWLVRHTHEGINSSHNMSITP